METVEKDMHYQFPKYSYTIITLIQQQGMPLNNELTTGN
jgi:hypothetical protein